MRNKSVISNNQIAKKLKTDMQIIIQYLVNNYPQIKSIYLCGGYGRNEGAWLYEKNGNLIPYNDYDLTLIVEDKNLDNIEVVKKELANKVSIKWIDIDLLSLKELKNLKPTIKSVDLVNGSQLIYGKDVIKNISINSKKIGYYDIETLYFTRIWCFLGSFEGEFHDLNVDESVFFKNQMAKAILATMDVYLILHKMYTSSYIERVKIIKTIINDKKYIQLIDWALNEKLRPSTEPLKKEDMSHLYNEVYNIYIYTFKKGFGRKYYLIENSKKTKYLYYMQIRHLIRLVLNSYIRKNSIYKNYILINVMQNELLHAYNYGNIEKKKVFDVNRKMQYFKADYSLQSNWFETKCLVANVRNGDFL